MAETNLKTQKTETSVKGFLETIEDSQKKSDSFIILDMKQKAMGEKPKMWGTSIIGRWDSHHESKALRSM